MTRLVVANWKMNPQTLEEARALASQIESGLLTMSQSLVETVICPPFVFLPPLRIVVHSGFLGSQNLAAQAAGPFTGEISARQLQEFGVRYVIIGHSERRALGETDELISQKLGLALKHRFEPILCVGYGAKRSFSSSAIKRLVKSQVQKAVKGLSVSRGAPLAIAYEPVWAISQGLGTGQAVKPSHASEIIKFIKTQAPSARVIYGGSLDSKNAASFAAQKVIEGGLVGGASLNAEEFLGIIRAFSI